MLDFTALPRADLTDDGGRPLDGLLLVTADIAEAVAEAVRQGYAVMPAGGLTSAIGSFDFAAEAVSAFKGVVVIRPKGAVEAEEVDAATPIEQLKSHQVAIDVAQGLVAAGAGLTLTQVNAALAAKVGPTARVLVDLTSIGSAFVGGVIATGAMGPLRQRPSATLEAVVLADGGAPRRLAGEDIGRVEGLQGWTGMVSAASFRFYQVPPGEFGLVLPIQGTDIDTIAGLLAYLEKWTRIDLPAPGGRLGGAEALLNGVELVSRNSLAEFIAASEDPARSKAEGLLQSCDYAGADMLACLTGWSDLSVDDVLFSLMDPETETIGGVMIEYGVGFSSGAEMETFRAIREGAPDLARTRARVKTPGRLKPWSTSTDINIVAPAESGVISDILAAYAEYRAAIRALAGESAGAVDVELAAYGHLSPRGIDTHHRVILVADEGRDAELDTARQTVVGLKRELIRALLHAAAQGGAEVNGGEKGMPSLVEIARAAGGLDRLPQALKPRFELGRQAVAAAPPNFAFRASHEIREAK